MLGSSVKAEVKKTSKIRLQLISTNFSLIYREIGAIIGPQCRPTALHREEKLLVCPLYSTVQALSTAAVMRKSIAASSPPSWYSKHSEHVQTCPLTWKYFYNKLQRNYNGNWHDKHYIISSYYHSVHCTSPQARHCMEYDWWYVNQTVRTPKKYAQNIISL